MPWAYDFPSITGHDGSWRIDAVISLGEWMIGVSFGEADIVIKPLPCVVICIEFNEPGFFS